MLFETQTFKLELLLDLCYILFPVSLVNVFVVLYQPINTKTLLEKQAEQNNQQILQNFWSVILEWSKLWFIVLFFELSRQGETAVPGGGKVTITIRMGKHKKSQQSHESYHTNFWGIALKLDSSQWTSITWTNKFNSRSLNLSSVSVFSVDV